MKFLAQLLLILTLLCGIGLDMANATEDLADLHATETATTIYFADAGEASCETDPELGAPAAPKRCNTPVLRASRPTSDSPPVSATPLPRLRPPTGPRLA